MAESLEVSAMLVNYSDSAMPKDSEFSSPLRIMMAQPCSRSCKVLMTQPCLTITMAQPCLRSCKIFMTQPCLKDSIFRILQSLENYDDSAMLNNFHVSAMLVNYNGSAMPKEM